MHEEAWNLESEAQCLETEGLEKMEVAVTGSEVEGFYGLLKGAVLHSSLPTSSPPLRGLAVPLLLLFHICPLRNPKNLKPLFLQNRHWSLPL